MLEALQRAGFMDGMTIHGWTEHNDYHSTFSKRAKVAAKARWDKTRKDKKEKRIDKKGEDKSKHMLAMPDALLQASHDFTSEWEHFKDHRKAIKHPMTPHAQELILKSLCERPESALKAVQMAIKNNWRGFEWTWYDNNLQSNNGKAARRVRGRAQASRDRRQEPGIPRTQAQGGETMRSTEREDFILDKCASSNCKGSQGGPWKRHRKLYLDEHWDVHPPTEFLAWMALRRPDINPIKAWNAAGLREEWQAEKDHGIDREPDFVPSREQALANLDRLKQLVAKIGRPMPDPLPTDYDRGAIGKPEY